MLRLTLLVALLGLCWGQGCPGRMFVAHDQHMWEPAAWRKPYSTQQFLLNVVQFLANGKSGAKFLYNDRTNMLDTKRAPAVLKSAGYSWEWCGSKGEINDEATLMKYDIIAVSSYGSPDPMLLKKLLQKGKSILVMLGIGTRLGKPFGPKAEGDFWNPFLTSVGLWVGGSATNQWNNIKGANYMTGQAHPIFDRVVAIYENTGNDVYDMDVFNPGNRVIDWFKGHPLYAIYDGKMDSSLKCGTCNNNGQCEAGETYVNCPQDCKTARCPGKIWLDSDEHGTQVNTGGNRADLYLKNLMNWFTNSKPGRILIRHALQPKYSASVIKTIQDAGFGVVVNPNYAMTAKSLASFDIVWTSHKPPLDVLEAYVKSGGNVFIQLGYGSANGQQESAFWDPFLTKFGLKSGSVYIRKSGTVAMQGKHCVSRGVGKTYWGHGNPVQDIDPNNPGNQVVEYFGQYGAMAFYDGTWDTKTTCGCGGKLMVMFDDLAFTTCCGGAAWNKPNNPQQYLMNIVTWMSKGRKTKILDITPSSPALTNPAKMKPLLTNNGYEYTRKAITSSAQMPFSVFSGYDIIIVGGDATVNTASVQQFLDQGGNVLIIAGYNNRAAAVTALNPILTKKGLRLSNKGINLSRRNMRPLSSHCVFNGVGSLLMDAITDIDDLDGLDYSQQIIATYNGYGAAAVWDGDMDILGQCKTTRCTVGNCMCTGKPDGTKCNDGDPKTSNDVCKGGVCAGQAVCVSGDCTCKGKTDGTKCDDGSLKTKGDVCKGGKCIGRACTGKVFVAHDQHMWDNGKSTWAAPHNPGPFLVNIINWITEGVSGTVLGATRTKPGTAFQMLHPTNVPNTLKAAGHKYTLAPFPIKWDLTAMLQYDVMIVSTLEKPDMAFLQRYLDMGGSLIIELGIGNLGPQAEADLWNPLLTPLGLKVAGGSQWNMVRGTNNIGGHPHPLFDGVNAIYENTGNDIWDLDVFNPGAQVIDWMQNHPLYAVYDPAYDPARKCGDCNNDGKCDANENWISCAADCKKQACPGKLFVEFDDGMYNPAAWAAPSQYGKVAKNVVNWFLDGLPGAVYVATSAAPTKAQITKNMIDNGVGVVFQDQRAINTLTDMKMFNAIYVNKAWSTAQTPWLDQYLKLGGNIHIVTGVDSATGQAEADYWNPFLKPYGLGIGNTLTTDTGTFKPTGDHCTTAGVTSVRYSKFNNGLVDLDANNNAAEVIDYVQGKGAYATYDGKYDPNSKCGCGGRMVVFWDEWVFTSKAFSSTYRSDTSQFLINLMRFFTLGKTGKFLDQTGLVQKEAKDWIESNGGTLDAAVTTLDLTTAQKYNAIFLISANKPDFGILSQYMAAGGNIFIMLGTGNGGAPVEAAFWGPFLAAYGIGVKPTYITTASQTMTITGDHCLLAGVTKLYQIHGQPLIDLDGFDPANQIINYYQLNDAIALYDGRSETKGGQCGNICKVGDCMCYRKPDGYPCNDGNPKTGGDSCTNGRCVGTIKCTVGDCMCTGKPDGTKCDDGKASTTKDQCMGGKCVGTSKILDILMRCNCQAAKADTMSRFGPRCNLPSSTTALGSFETHKGLDLDDEFGQGAWTWNPSPTTLEAIGGKWICKKI